MSNAKEPLVSVIIPSYNAAKFLKTSVGSVLKQSYKNVEAVIVNDGSADNTLEVAKELAKKYKNIVVATKENGGLGFARNTGFKHAHGEYYYLLDADDSITEHCIERLVETAVKEDADVVCTMIDQSLTKEKLGKKPVRTVSGVEALCEDLNMHIPTASCGRLYHKSIFEKEKFTNIRYAEDFEFNIRFWPKAKRVAIMDDYTYLYAITPGSMMNSPYSEKKSEIISTILKLEKMSKDKKYSDKVRNTMRSGCYLQALATLLNLYETGVKSFPKDYRKLARIAKRNSRYTFFNKEVDMLHRKFALCSMVSVRLTLWMIKRAGRKAQNEQ